jgi:hypothetical protein
LRRLLDSLDDASVSPAAAEVIVHGFDDLPAAGTGVFQQQTVGGEDHPRGAKSALQSIVLDESRLERVQLAVPGQAFDSDDLFLIDVGQRELAGAYRLVIDKDRTRPAKTFAAAELRSGKIEIRAQHPEKHAVAVNLKALRFSVELKADCLIHGFLLPYDWLVFRSTVGLAAIVFDSGH